MGLTLERLRELGTYDPKTGEFQWFIRPGRRKKTTGTSKTAAGYRQVQIDGKGYYLHRLAFLFMTGTVPKIVDHINGDKEDNRWDNLRGVSAAVNYRNRPQNRNSTTGVKGVTYDQGRDKYVAQLTVNRKRKFLGRYGTVAEAESAYLSAVAKLVGGIQYREVSGV